MYSFHSSSCTAFLGNHKIARGPLTDVALAIKKKLDEDQAAQVLIFDNETSKIIELDLSGSPEDILYRVKFLARGHEGPSEEKKPGPGRPKLGVVSREISLLPRHWEWLNAQPGGASVTLRKLVEEAKKKYAKKDKVRESQNATYQFMLAMAGDLPGYEEALRVLFASEKDKFHNLIANWPGDLREHIELLAQTAFIGKGNS